MSIERTDEQQERADMLKTLRAIIRLKHSLAADRELNAVLPAAEKYFDKMVHKGKQPTPLEVKRAMHL